MAFAEDYDHKIYVGDTEQNRADLGTDPLLNSDGKSAPYVLITPAYPISYELNDGALPDGTDNPAVYTRADSIILNNPERESHTFMGWTGSNGETPDTAVAIPEGSTGEKSYTANWGKTVTVAKGGGMTWLQTSGEEEQTGLTGDDAIMPVVYTADDEHYFPEGYSAESVNGISVTRDSNTQITVSGTPTGNTTFTLPDAAEKMPETTPSAEFLADGYDSGVLTGVASGMKYSLDGGNTWVDIEDDSVEIVSGVTTDAGILVYQPSTGETAVDSDAQRIAVTRAQAPVLSVLPPTTIGGAVTIPTTESHEWRPDEEGTDWADCEDGLRIETTGTYFVRVKASGTVLASDPQTFSVILFNPPKEDTPEAAFEATGADCGTLTDVAAGMRYSIDGGVTWVGISGTEAVIASGVTAENGILVYQPGNGATTTDSEAQAIVISKAAVPNLAAAQPSVIGGTGSIPTTAAHEWSANGTDWTACEGEITGLEAGTYYVRVKADGTTLASDPQRITISAYEPGREITPSATFTATGTDTGELTGLIDGVEYALTGANPASFTASGTAQNLTGVSAGALLLVRKGNGTTLDDSDPQSMTVFKAETPEITATQPAVIGGTGSIPVTAAYQKSTDGETWTDCDGVWKDLAAGIYYIRVKASGATLASDAQTIEIVDFVPDKEATPEAVFTATGADSGTLANVAAGMKYSVDGGSTWTEIAGESAEIDAGVNVFYGIRVYHPAEDETTTLDSDVQIIAVSKAKTPALPAIQPSVIGGTVTIPTTESHEWSTDGETWTACGGELTGLTTGIYFVRVKPDGTTLASDPQTFSITTFNPEKEPVPAAVFNATGTDCGALTNVSDGMRYSTDGGSSWTRIAGTSAMIASGVTAADGILIYQPGNGTSTIDSDTQVIAVAKAATPNLVAIQPTVIGGTGILPTTAEHQWSEDGEAWTDCGGIMTGLEAGTWLVRVKPDGTTLASDPQTITISAYEPGKEMTPSATFTATGADTGTLSGLTDGAAYALDGAAPALFIASGTQQDLTGVSEGTLSLTRKGDGKMIGDSDAQIFTVSRAETPNLTAAQPAVIGGTGSIPTTAEHQWSKDGEAWTDCDGEWTGLAAGTYYVRVKASGATLASGAQEIEITEFVPGKEAAPEAVFTATGADCGTLSNVTEGMRYSVDGGKTWHNIAGESAEIASGVNAFYGVRVYRLSTDAATVLDSDEQIIAVSKAKTPALPVVPPATPGGTFSIPTTTDYQQSTDGKTWTDCVGLMTGLSSGTWFVRVKADGTTLASDPQTITIASYDPGELPEFGVPDLRLPAAMKRIGPSAFEGIAARIVFIPDGCETIGPRAFALCLKLTQVRVPDTVKKAADIADDAFAGCGRVYLFGTPGGAAETYCETHENCTFVPEKKN